jgi:hypothetical protein
MARGIDYYYYSIGQTYINLIQRLGDWRKKKGRKLWKGGGGGGAWVAFSFHELSLHSSLDSLYYGLVCLEWN